MPRMSRSGGPNFLGAKFAPFVVADNPNSSSFRVRDVALPRGLDSGRFSTRRNIRDQVDRLLRINDKAAGDPVVAADCMGAGVGQTVIVTSDGQQAQVSLGSDTTPVRWTVVGIRDE